MLRQIRQSADRRAHLVHFPESAPTGYFSKDIPSIRDLDWDSVGRAEHALADAAAEAKLWVVFGTYRRYRDRKPFNSLRAIAPDGKLAATYDKRALFDRNDENIECSPGTKPRVIVVQGVRCGLLICNDSNRESLYHRYRKLGVKVLVHSYYNARSTRGRTALDEVIVSQLRTRAFDHGFWIAASNSSARYSRLSACLAAPDGTVTGLRRHRTGVHIAEVPLPGLIP